MSTGALPPTGAAPPQSLSRGAADGGNSCC